MPFRGSQDRYLPLIEFAYNNNYQSSIQSSAPFEASYRRKCKTPICWDEVGERQLLWPEIFQNTNEKINIIREKLKAVLNKQKSYVDKQQRPLEFAVGDKVFLWISPQKGILRFGKHGKLSPRYIGPCETIQRVGPLAYRLSLPLESS